MHGRARFALDHPVYDPGTQILPGHRWDAERNMAACLIVSMATD